MTANQAAEKLKAEMVRRGQARDVPLDVWVAIVFAILDAFQLCQPEPDDAYDVVTWKPGWFAWVFGQYDRRLASHRGRLKAVVRAVDGSTLDAAFALVDRGEFTRNHFRDLFAAARMRKRDVSWDVVPPLEGPAV